MVAHVCNTSAGETEAGGALSLVGEPFVSCILVRDLTQKRWAGRGAAGDWQEPYYDSKLCPLISTPSQVCRHKKNKEIKQGEKQEKQRKERVRGRGRRLVSKEGKKKENGKERRKRGNRRGRDERE